MRNSIYPEGIIAAEKQLSTILISYHHEKNQSHEHDKPQAYFLPEQNSVPPILSDLR